MDDRPLTDEERVLARWMLEHGTLDAPSFLPQLDAARVVGRCSCGCASVDLAVEGRPSTAGGPFGVLGDFLYGDGAGLWGIFIFERNGILAGLEVYALNGDTPARLPAPDSLRLWDCDPPSAS